MRLTTKLLSLFTVAVFGIATMAITEADKKAGEWTIDKAHSSVNFEVRHFFSNVPSAFEEFSADIYFDPNILNESSIDVTIQVASINTKNDKRDGHLQSSDFFNAEKYPTMRFTSNKIVKKGDDKFVAKGQLTIKDVTKDFELPFTLLGVMEKEDGTKVAGFNSEFTLLRNDYGVGTGDYISDTVIGNEVEVTLNMELNAPSSAGTW